MKTEAEVTRMKERVVQVARRIESFREPRLRMVADTLISIIASLDFVLSNETLLENLISNLEKEFGTLARQITPSDN